eukprot:TRINITY_DN21462_c0_g1_i6.p1 TRINITY_DN21462_c0_g1~~TRINITY_DN21462_c0_g1_i6.p1  ORF type:complete len:1009 (+),score=228.23 TRINITY_DN21462_c0_g1_i6:59-3085(+)
MAVESLEVEAPPPRPRAAQQPLPDYWRISIGVVVSLLLLQTLLLGRLAFRTDGGSEGGSKAPEASTRHPERPQEPQEPVEPAGGGGSCDPGLVGAHGSDMETFEAKHRKYKTEFCTVWKDPLEHSEVYLEFPMDLLKRQENPVLLSVSAIFANGDFAHMDATAGPQPMIVAALSDDGRYVEFQEPDLEFRQVSEDYSTLFGAYGPSSVLARLPKVAVRRSGPDCKVSSVIVSAGVFFGEGALVAEPKGRYTIHGPSLKVFARNIDVTVLWGSVAVRFCLFKLPDDPLPGRVADDRVGYFDIPFRDLGDFRAGGKWGDLRGSELIDPPTSVIQRQRVHRNAKGEPEILVYVDHTVPKAFHEATKRGVHKWQAAFMEIYNAPVVRALAPGDEDFPSDYDVADVRFNSISWAMGQSESSPFAIGQSVTDPRSGEILKANIVFTLGWLSAWLGEALLYYPGLPGTHPAAVTDFHTLQQASSTQRQEFLARRLEAAAQPSTRGRGLGHAEASLIREGLSQRTRAPEPSEHIWHNISGSSWMKPCRQQGRSLRHRHPHEDMLCRAMLDTSAHLLFASRSFDDDATKAFLEAGIADVSGHEFGHTLGLRHNFQGSLIVSFADSQDVEVTTKKGLSSSVMDYMPVNLVSAKARADLSKTDSSVHYFTPVIGAYDKFAIKYGYTPIQDERCCGKHEELKKIAEEYETAEFSFATDEDADWGHGVDPYTRRHDMTGEPLKYHIDQLQLVKETQAAILERALQPGDSYTRLQDMEIMLLSTAFKALEELTAFVGGLRISRRHHKDPDQGEAPVQAVPLEEQLEALAAILSFLTADMGESALPDGKLEGKFIGHKGLGRIPGSVEPIVKRVKALAMKSLLGGVRLNFMTLSGRLAGESTLVKKVLRTTVEALFGIDKDAVLPAEDGSGGEVEKRALEKISSRHLAHVQLEFLAILSAEREAYTAYEASIGLDIKVELERLATWFSALERSVAAAAPSQDGAEAKLRQMAFITEAIALLGR